MHFHIVSTTSGQILMNLILGINTQSIYKLDGECDPCGGGGQGGNCIRCIDCDGQVSGQTPGALFNKCLKNMFVVFNIC